MKVVEVPNRRILEYLYEYHHLAPNILSKYTNQNGHIQPVKRGGCQSLPSMEFLQKTAVFERISFTRSKGTNLGQIFAMQFEDSRGCQILLPIEWSCIRGLIAGLIKGNQWVFISPDHSQALFLGGGPCKILSLTFRGVDPGGNSHHQNYYIFSRESL